MDASLPPRVWQDSQGPALQVETSTHYLSTQHMEALKRFADAGVAKLVKRGMVEAAKDAKMVFDVALLACMRWRE